MSKAKTSTKPDKTKSTAKKPRTDVSWTGSARAPRQRWYWWVVFIVISVWLVSAKVLLGHFFFAALLIVMAISLGLLYGQKADKHSYQLSGQTLTVDGKRKLDLADYKHYYTEKAWETYNQDFKSGKVLVLSHLGIPTIRHRRIQRPLTHE